MDLRRVKYFIAVAEELNFRRAADRLYVTQPVVSEHIRKLEAELGVQLLVRTPQFVRLTEAGAAFLADARRLLEQAAEVEETVRRTRDAAAGWVRVGLTPDLLPPTLPDALRATTQARVRVEGCRRLLDDVRRERLDAAIVALPAPVAGLRVRQIATEAAVVLGGPATLADLAGEPLLILARDASPGFHDAVTASFVAAGLHAELVDHPATSLDQLMLEAAGARVRAIVPASAAQRMAMLPVSEVLGGPRAAVALVTRDEAPSVALDAFACALMPARELRAVA